MKAPFGTSVSALLLKLQERDNAENQGLCTLESGCVIKYTASLKILNTFL